MSELLNAVPLLLRLGLAVYEAVKAGNTTKTVGQIFADVPTDMAEIERLEVEFLAGKGKA